MDFKAATDQLTQRTTLSEIAEACGVSENLVQRARMTGEQSRAAPPNWREAIIQLAEERIEALRRLVTALRGG